MTDEDRSYPDAREYVGADITVLYDRSRCVHFAECIRGLPGVFDATRKPWIQPANAAASELADVIERCPSGALHYTMASRTESPDAPTTVHQNARGQVLLRGDLRVVGDEGEVLVVETRMTACGCGASARRPFCDRSCDDPA